MLLYLLIGFEPLQYIDCYKSPRINAAQVQVLMIIYIGQFCNNNSDLHAALASPGWLSS